MDCCNKIFGNLIYAEEKNVNTIDFDDKTHTPINQIIKILVLGTGDSGKSTILKQMRIIHGKNYTINERKKYCHLVIQNIIDCIVRLAETMKLFGLSFENNSNIEGFDSILACQQCLRIDLNDWNRNHTNYHKIIKSIWDDNSIQILLKNKNKFYLNDSIEYFINNLSRICSINYIPEIDDLLRVRQPTTAISEYKFKISGTYFLFVDVGGQRSERRKWINCFENVTSLLFVASLSDYDSILSIEELKSTGDTIRIVNRMKESIDLFHTLINWKKKTYLNKDKSDIIQTVKETFLFDKVSIILFLNKEDLFIEKFRFSSIKECFEDYQENDSIDKAKEFIANKFIENDKYHREIYWHATFALDRKNIETVVEYVKDRIIKYMIESMRL